MKYTPQNNSVSLYPFSFCLSLFHQSGIPLQNRWLLSIRFILPFTHSSWTGSFSYVILRYTHAPMTNMLELKHCCISLKAQFYVSTTNICFMCIVECIQVRYMGLIMFCMWYTCGCCDLSLVGNYGSSSLFTKMCLKVPFLKWRPFCLSLNLLKWRFVLQ